MGLKLKTGSGLSLGSGLGLGLGNGHAYAATGAVVGTFATTVLVVGGAILLVLGVKKLVSSRKNKLKTAN